MQQSVQPPWSAFAGVSFAYFASIGLYTTYAPLWFKSLGYSALAIGLVASLQSWTRILVPFAWGWMADHTGRRVWLLRWAAALSLVFGSSLWGAHILGVLPLAVFCFFLCNGGVVPLSEAALSRHLQTSGGMDAARYGRIRVWGSVGFIVSVTVAGMALDRWGIDLFAWGVAAVLVGLLAASFRLPSQVDRGVDVQGEERSLWAVLRTPAVRWFFLTVFFTVLGHTSLYAFLSLYLDDLGYGRSVVGLVWAVAVVAEIVFFAFGAGWAARWTAVQWLFGAAVLSVLRFAAIAQAGQWLPILLLAQLLHGLTFAAQHAACTSLLNHHFPGRLRGRGQALYAVLGYGASGVLGGAGGGWLTESWGYSSVFWAATVSALVAVGCGLQLQRHVPNEASRR